MDEQEPDFDALVASWLANDPRIQGDEPDDFQVRVAKRLAAALAERRREVARQAGHEGGDLVVHIDRDSLSEGKLNQDILSQLAGFVEEIRQPEEQKEDSEGV